MKAMLSEEDVIGPNDGMILARIRDFATRHVNDYGPVKILFNHLDTIVSIFESVRNQLDGLHRIRGDTDLSSGLLAICHMQPLHLSYRELVLIVN